MVRLRPLAKGLLTFLPGIPGLLRGDGGAESAAYCHTVWLRHLILLRQAGMKIPPQDVAELGPGNSLGLGLMALLTGSRSYRAFDVVAHANSRTSLEVLPGLAQLLSQRLPPGDDTQFNKVFPKLEEYLFPSDFLTDEMMESTLKPVRISMLRAALADLSMPASPLRYVAPWFTRGNLEPESVDLVFSQAVLEHVDELEATYRQLFQWLRPGGFMSHEVDFKSHGLTHGWNGHWGIPEPLWRLVRGRRPYLLNREPLSTHLRLLKDSGFELRLVSPTLRQPDLERSRLARRFRNMSDEDLSTVNAYIIAVKP